MPISRRHAIAGLTAGATLGVAPRRSRAAVTPGKPFAGQTVRVLVVRASQYAAQAKRLPKFEQDTGIKVEFVDVPFASMREKLTAEMVAGSPDFDLATVMDAWIPSLVGTYFGPIGQDLKARGVDLTRYPQPFLYTSLHKDDVYGLPTRCHIQLLFYRKDIFADLGLAVPKTWDDVVAAGLKIQEKTKLAGIAIPYGRNAGQNLMVWYNFLWGAGSDLFDDKMKPMFNNAAGLKATQDYVDLLLKHKICPSGAASFTEPDAVTSMVQGNSAMNPVWWHVYNRYAMKDATIGLDKVGFVPLPTYAGAEPTTYTNTWIYGVNKNSKVRGAALEFLTWISEPDIERSILLDPAENDVVATQWTNLRDAAVNERFHGMHRTAAVALEKTRKLVPNIPEFLPVVDVLEVAMNNIATGQATVADAMNGAATQVARLVRRG
jgi:multiple sugar transport system substrate-binding protein